MSVTQKSGLRLQSFVAEWSNVREEINHMNLADFLHQSPRYLKMAFEEGLGITIVTEKLIEYSLLVMSPSPLQQLLNKGVVVVITPLLEPGDKFDLETNLFDLIAIAFEKKHLLWPMVMMLP
jgi:hypothetical protein